MLYLQLFFAFIEIGLFSFGGGYAIIPLIQNKVVTTYQWLTITEFTNIIAIAEATPGPLAVNCATYSGYLSGGFLGATVATIGIVLPSFILILALASILIKNQNNINVQAVFSGLRPIVVALIISAAISLGYNTLIDFKQVILTAIAFLIALFTKIHPILLIIGFGILGIIIY